MNGLLVVDKPKGPTSHDIVLKVRKKLHQRKVGHTGTLDPQATGVLVLALGTATKMVSTLIVKDKRYEVTLLLGTKTDTGDTSGKITEKNEIKNINAERIKEVFSGFKGSLMQTPPMVSAKKYKGKPLYKYARQGKTVKRKPRMIHIYNINIQKIDIPEISFMVHCSKGTYIRTLCEDIGKELDTVACASHIRRIQNGSFSISQSISMEKFMHLDNNDIKDIILNPKTNTC